MIRITLAKIGKNKTVNYAIEELYTYLKRIDDTLFVDIRSYSEYDESVDRVVWVGESDDFSSFLLPVDDKKLDDSIYVNVENNSGIITGCNPRAVLIAAYRFLKELGISWVRPTDDGEIVPQYRITSINVKVQEKASYRHRAICIEGDVSYEHVFDMIKWIPRVGMSGYFFQFFIPFRFMDRWYTHYANEFIEPDCVTREDVTAMLGSLVEELKKRGLLFHHVGHGWTSTPFGFEGNGGYPVDPSSVPQEKKWHLAMLNGKREFRGNVPNWTNLCYSNSKVREIIVNTIVDYCKNNSDVDLLHFWLADGEKNSCECENCTERPSDYYVMMLNDLDEKLTALSIDTKIVFLTYADVTWAPLKEKIKNKERFTLMLAPGGRSYAYGFDSITDPRSYESVPYEKNRSASPSDIGKCAKLLSEWQEMFDGDSFDFDYHLFARQWRDIGGMYIARRVFVDMQNLDKLSLNGMVSCQVTRNAFPTALPTYMMAVALWNKNADFDKESDKYFLASFGENGAAVKKYLDALSDCFYEPDLQKLECALALTEEMRPLIEAALTKENGNRKRSWEYLAYHRRTTSLISDCLLDKYKGKREESLEKWEQIKKVLKINELNYHKILDVSQFIIRMDGMVKSEVKNEIINN